MRDTARETVDCDQLVSEQQRRLGPDEHVADPPAIAALGPGYWTSSAECGEAADVVH
jgi:hypothetical protein